MPEWFQSRTAPKNPTETKDFNGRTWHWCGKSTGGGCEQWRLHKSSDCYKTRLTNTTDATRLANTTNATKQEPPPKKRVRFAKAVEARIKALEAKINNNNKDNLGPHSEDAFDFK